MGLAEIFDGSMTNGSSARVHLTFNSLGNKKAEDYAVSSLKHHLTIKPRWKSKLRTIRVGMFSALCEYTKRKRHSLSP